VKTDVSLTPRGCGYDPVEQCSVSEIAVLLCLDELLYDVVHEVDTESRRVKMLRG